MTAVIMDSAVNRALGNAVTSVPFGAELLDALNRLLNPAATVTPNDVGFLIDRVHGSDYSTLDLISHLTDFKRVFSQSLRSHPDLAAPDQQSAESKVHSLLNQMQNVALQQTAGIYECIVETQWLPVCQIDCNGKIEYANGAMCKLLAVDPLIGTQMEDHFVMDDKDSVSNAITEGIRGDALSKRELRLRRADGQQYRVAINVQPLNSGDCRLGAYVSLFDIEEVIAHQEKFLDRLLLPAIKLNLNRIITYANPAIYRLLGSDRELRGLSIFKIFPRTKAMSSRLTSREEGKADVYETQIVRPKDGKRIPVSVVGTPIVDEDDRCIGTLGLIRSLERDKAAEAIHRLMNTTQDEKSLLEGMAKQIGHAVAFDSFRVSQFSLDSNHISLWFAYTPGGTIEMHRRWWPLSQARKQELEQTVIRTDYADYIRANWPDADTDPSLRQLLSEGYKTALRVPIWREGRVAATVTLLSKTQQAYSPEDLEELKALPLEQAVQLAIFYRSRREAEFRFNLFKDLVNCSHTRDVVELLVSRLATTYKWHHASVFDVCETEGVFRLAAECSGQGLNLPLANKREQKITAGILATVYETQKRINVPDVLEGEWAGQCVRTWPEVRSELCLPLIWDGKVHSLLNIEDERINAFSTDEELAISIIVDQSQMVLGRIWRQDVLQSAYESSSDTIFITDMRGNVLSANPTAAKLLGFDEPKDMLVPLETFFKDHLVFRRIFELTGTSSTEAELRCRDGLYVPVLISGSQLEESLARKIFIAKDLRLLKRIQKLEGLRNLFEEVAVQTHTPLAMVQTWLLRFREKAADAADSEWASRLLAQLKKAEISYHRLALSVDADRVTGLSNKLSLDMSTELNSCLSEFPTQEAARVKISVPDGLPYVKADPAHVSFIFSTILSYLLRDGGEQTIEVNASCTTSAVKIRFAGLEPGLSTSSESNRWLAQARLDLALGEPAIRAFAVNNGATYAREADETHTILTVSFSILE
jgi:PAS domain S-box-containing protein